MKRSLFSIGLLAIILSCFTACGEKPDDSQKPDHQPDSTPTELVVPLSIDSLVCPENRDRFWYDSVGYGVCLLPEWEIELIPDPRGDFILKGPLTSDADIFQENVVFARESFTSLDLDAYIDNLVGQMVMGLQGYQELGRGEAVVNGTSARWLKYNQTVNGHVTTTKYYFIQRTQNLLHITGTQLAVEFGPFERELENLMRTMWWKQG